MLDAVCYSHCASVGIGGLKVDDFHQYVYRLIPKSSFCPEVLKEYTYTFEVVAAF